MWHKTVAATWHRLRTYRYVLSACSARRKCQSVDKTATHKPDRQSKGGGDGEREREREGRQSGNESENQEMFTGLEHVLSALNPHSFIEQP